MLALKCLRKTRPFVTLLLLSHPFSSFPAYPSPLPRTSPPISSGIIESEATNQVVTTFKNWFKSGQNPLYERIFEILSSRVDDAPSSLLAADFELAQLNLRLTEPFVLGVLRYRDDVLCCLKFFDWAGRQPGFCHTGNTFNAIFKILSRAKLKSLTLDFVDTFMKQRYAHKHRYFNTLVMGYAVAGQPLVALEMFGRMRYRGQDLDPVAYHVLLNALVEASLFNETDVVLMHIKMRGYENAVTDNIVMKILCKRMQLDEAEKFLRGLVGRGKATDGRALGLLIDALCKQKKFKVGDRLIQEFKEMGSLPMAHAYGAWVGSLMQAGNADSALEFLHCKSSLEGYVPEVFRYNTLISKLLRRNMFEDVYDLLTEMNENQIVPDKVTMNIVLCFFCKVGMADVAIELYKSRSENRLTPNSMVHNYLLNTLCEDGNADEACQIMKTAIDQGYFPGKKTFDILSSLLCQEGKLDKLKDIVLFALEHDIMPGNSTYDKFISALCQSGRVEDGYLIHGELNRLGKVLSSSTYASMIYGFIYSNRGDVAARLLLEMQEKGHAPRRILFRAVICSLCEVDDPRRHLFQFFELQLSYHQPRTMIYNYFIDGALHAGKPDLAREIYENMRSSGIAPNLRTDILMLQSYLQSGRISDALNFYDEVGRRRKPGRKFYNAMVIGLCRANRSDYALAILSDIKRKGLIPALECYEEVIRLLAAENKYSDVRVLINDLEANGHRVSHFIGNVLLLQSFKSKSLHETWSRTRVANQETRSSIMLGQMLTSFSAHITADSRVEDLELVIQECFPMDIYSYNMLLRKLTMYQIDEALDLFKEIGKKGFKPNRWTYDILVHGLAKHGRKDEAMRWMEEMLHQGFYPSEATSLLL